jgi:hypothetical protein
MDQFLKELTQLSRKHKIAIGGCGCCGSPFLSKIEEKEIAGAYATSDDFNNGSFDQLRWETNV